MPTLGESREAFLSEMRKLSDPGERAQFEEVLDDLLAWSFSQGATLAHHDKEYTQHVVSVRIATGAQVIWSAYPKRNDGAKLALLPGGNTRIPELLRTEIVERLQRITTAPLHGDRKLDIPFRALKRPASRTAVKDVLTTLLSDPRVKFS